MGLNRKPWVKTSLAPGSQVVSEYLKAAGLQEDLDAIGFNLVGYGCTTCIGNSGPLQPEISAAITEGDLVATAVLSGNRNFEGPDQPGCARQLSGLAAAGRGLCAGRRHEHRPDDRTAGHGHERQPVYLKDIWPTNKEIADLVDATVTRAAFQKKYADVFKGDEKWQAVEITDSETYDWPPTSTYIQNPPYFHGMAKTPGRDQRHHRRARAGAAGRHDHHRPHQPGRFVQSLNSGRQVSDRTASSGVASSTPTARGAATMR